MGSIIDILKRLLDTIFDLLFGKRYIWPLSKSATPDEMNTSFGPRINRDKWDFHWVAADRVPVMSKSAGHCVIRAGGNVIKLEDKL